MLLLMNIHQSRPMKEQSLILEIKRFSTPEEKLHYLFSAMKQIVQEKKPNYQVFWEAKELALDLFKTLLAEAVRKPLWEEYSSIINEARCLKNFLPEQVRYSMEKLDNDLAVVKEEIDQFSKELNAMEDPDFISIDFLMEKKQQYCQMYKEAVMIRHLIKKLHAYKEKAMEVPFFALAKKNLVQRMNEQIHRVFPKRDLLIEQGSAMFKNELHEYLQELIAQNRKRKPYYQIREEIKKLQELSKIFFLDVAVFKEIRLYLNQKWQEVKQLEEKRKKIITEKKHLQKKNYNEALLQMQAFKEQTENQEDKDGLQKQAKEMLFSFSKMDLSKLQRKTLADAVDEAILPYKEQSKQQPLVKAKKKFDLVKAKETLILLLQKAESLNGKELEEEYAKIEKDLGPKASSIEEVQHFLYPVLARIASHKKMEEDLPKEEMLEFIENNRKDLKNQLEAYRRIIGGSNLDFEKAMTYNQLIEIEKNRLANLEEKLETLAEN